MYVSGIYVMLRNNGILFCYMRKEHNKSCINLGPKLTFQPHLLLLHYKYYSLHSYWFLSSSLTTLLWLCLWVFALTSSPPAFSLPDTSLSQSFSLRIALESFDLLPSQWGSQYATTVENHWCIWCLCHSKSRRMEGFEISAAIINGNLILTRWPELPPTSFSLWVMLDASPLWNPVSPQFLHILLGTCYISSYFLSYFFRSALLFIY